jgi:hypothetical protein
MEDQERDVRLILSWIILIFSWMLIITSSIHTKTKRRKKNKKGIP